MFEYRKLRLSDFSDITEISKNIWGGTDYLPHIFNDWLEAPGLFLGAVDTLKNKVAAVGKYSIFDDGSGWIEGLRTHVEYRGLKLGRGILERLMAEALRDLSEKKISRIACSTYFKNIESINLLTSIGFSITEKFVMIRKEVEDISRLKKIEEFKFE
ncbi:MAG TPA: GNAT family N-acetyltransferase, partial [Candidatus Wallbacteria bacterium]|nr:GNAT family N-acetyltransferase [Candidatus Wallbacteria bacterium]